MKKAEKERDTARKSASKARADGKNLAYVAALAPIGSALLATKVLPKLPGPTADEFAEALKAKKGPESSKRVITLGLVTLGLVFFGGNSWEARAAAAVSGAFTGDAITAWSQAALALSDPTAAAAMVMEVKP